MSTPAPTTEPIIQVDPQPAMLDTPLRIRLARFAPSSAVTLRMHMHDLIGRSWGAHATYLSDEHGAVDVPSQVPIEGTYSSADPMGLIWSMARLAETDSPEKYDQQTLPPARMTLTAEVGGRCIGELTFDRLHLAPHVRHTVVRERGIVGTLFRPIEGGPHPGVLLLGGAEGGLHADDAALLAAHGYAVLALAYFGMGGVPPLLINIPLEYFESAIAWLQGQEGVRSDRLAAMGGSRGGELALLLGATFPAIRAVVSQCGSGLITEGVGGGSLMECVHPGQPSWTFRGQGLPYLPMQVPPAFEAQARAGGPVDLGLVFRAALDHAGARDAATIPVERINGPVLLISAGDDRGWPSELLSDIAEDRLARYRHPHAYQHLRYAQAGHRIIAPPYGPVFLEAPGPGVAMAMGGTREATAFARADAWSRTLQFLAQHLQHDEPR